MTLFYDIILLIICNHSFHLHRGKSIKRRISVKNNKHSYISFMIFIQSLYSPSEKISYARIKTKGVSGILIKYPNLLSKIFSDIK